MCSPLTNNGIGMPNVCYPRKSYVLVESPIFNSVWPSRAVYFGFPLQCCGSRIRGSRIWRFTVSGNNHALDSRYFSPNFFALISTPFYKLLHTVLLTPFTKVALTAVMVEPIRKASVDANHTVVMLAFCFASAIRTVLLVRFYCNENQSVKRMDATIERRVCLLPPLYWVRGGVQGKIYKRTIIDIRKSVWSVYIMRTGVHIRLR